MKFCLILLLSFAAPAWAANVHVGIKYSFETAYSTIPTNQQAPVFELIDLIEKTKATHLLISGHTDWIADDMINQPLSEARANTVRQIVSSKINNIQIDTKGFGKSAPLSTNETEEGRALNRRFVSSFIDMDDEQKSLILSYVEKSKYLYLIEIENPKVEEKIVQLQEAEQKIEEPTANTVVTTEFVVEEAPQEKPPEPVQVKSVNKLKKKTVVKAASEKPTTPLLSRYSLGASTQQSYLVREDILGSGSGVNADWVSKLNFGINGAYQFQLNSNFWIGAALAIDFQNFYDQTNPMFSWDKKTPVTTKFSLVTDYEKNNFGFGVNLDIYEDILLKENSLNLSFDKVLVYGLTAETKYYFLNTKNYNLGFNFDLNFPVSSSETFASLGDVGYTIALLAKSKTLSFKNKESWVRIFYKDLTYSLNTGPQKNSYAGFEISFRNLNWL